MISFPQDISTNILQRLPYDSILTSKLVSKQWKNLINDPNFSKHYTDKSCTTLFMCKRILYCLLIRHNDDDNLISASNERLPTLALHPIRNFSNNDTRLLSGSSNFIACVKSSDNRFHLYNLFTRTWYDVVEDAPLKDYSSECWLSYGFGYDRYDDDHKIMAIIRYKNRENGLEEDSRFWIYSFRNRCWKPFKGFPYVGYDWSSLRDYGEAPSYSFNGVLHWVVVKMGDDPKEVIVTYDLHANRFGEISMPSSVGYDEWDDCRTLGELNGELCLVYRLWDRVEVWVMKEYCSWEMVLRFDKFKIRSEYDCMTPAMICGDERKGVLLFKDVDIQMLIRYVVEGEEPLYLGEVINLGCVC